MADLQNIPLDQLHPHPDNPRIHMREDRVAQITAEVERLGFQQHHAILVRPYGDGYQIISGHHRVEAAKRAGLTEMPCWSEEMDDDEAYMQLLLSNTQGELSPLEYGKHLAGYVRRGIGGRGNEGGMRGYARRLAMEDENAKSGVELLRRQKAYEVYENCYDIVAVSGAPVPGHNHFYEISKAPAEARPTLVDALVKHGWTVADTQHHVQQIKAFDIPQRWAFWLPLNEVVAAHLDTREFSPRTVHRLIAAAEQTEAWIGTNANDPDTARAEFWSWLKANKGGKSWQPRAVAEYLQKLIAAQFVVEGWHHGDWRDHLDTIDDGTVGLLLTDPPYGQGFQSDRRLDRRNPRRHNTIAADSTPEEAEAELLAALEAFAPKLADNAHILVFCSWSGEPGMRETIAKAGYTLRGSLIWDKQTRGMGDPDTTFAPAHERILHAVKGSPPLYRRAADLMSHPRCDASRHPTEKPEPLLAELIDATTTEGQLVADPFGGVASTAAAAKQSGRRWWSCEREEKYWQAGEERLSR